MIQVHALKTKILILVYSWQTLQGIMSDGTFSFGFPDNHGGASIWPLVAGGQIADLVRFPRTRR